MIMSRFTLDKLVTWDHPNSHLVINQCKRLLASYRIYIEGGYQEFRIDGAIYETEQIDNKEKSYCTFTLPSEYTQVVDHQKK